MAFVCANAAACQLVVDVSGYSFDPLPDAGSVAPLEPARPAREDASAPAQLDAAFAVPAPSSDAGDAALSEPPQPTPDPTPIPPDLPPPDPPPHPQYGCSVVEYCNANQADGSGDQERCLQRGCSVEAAINECRQEVRTVCGNVGPPYVFITLTNQRTVLN